MALTKIPSELSSTTGIVDNSNATAITIDSNENVGIGTSSPSNYYSTTLVVDAPDEDGITVVSPTTGSGYLMFADGTSGNARYRGYIAYAHAVDEMQFATSGLTRMRIDASGRVTTPSQPTFNAYRNTGTIAFTSAGTFLCNAIRHNVGNHFSTSTGRFTAPVAGVYHFTFHTIYYSTLSNGVMYLNKNGSALDGTHTHFSSNQSSVWNTARIATTISLNANDYIEPYNNNFPVTYHGQAWNSFAGYLLG